MHRWACLRGFLQKAGEKVTAEQLGQFMQITGRVAKLADNYVRIRAWDAKGQDLLLKHLAFTLLVPGGKATRARQAVLDLEKNGFFEHPDKWSEGNVAAVIRSNVRFHNTKANSLKGAIAFMRAAAGPGVPPNCFMAAEPTRATLERTNGWLTTYISGMGFKAAAHFMRNAGLFCCEFAYPIIDVHIHKLLEACQMKHAHYKEAEASFYVLSSLVGIPVILLDAYAWCAYSGNWAPEQADFDNFSP